MTLPQDLAYGTTASVIIQAITGEVAINPAGRWHIADHPAPGDGPVVITTGLGTGDAAGLKSRLPKSNTAPIYSPVTRHSRWPHAAAALPPSGHGSNGATAARRIRRSAVPTPKARTAFGIPESRAVFVVFGVNPLMRRDFERRLPDHGHPDEAAAAGNTVFNARRRIRKIFGNIHEVVQMPNLIEVQRE